MLKHNPSRLSMLRAFLFTLTCLAPPHTLLVAYWGADCAALFSVPTHDEYFLSSGRVDVPSYTCSIFLFLIYHLHLRQLHPIHTTLPTQRCRRGRKHAKREQLLGSRASHSLSEYETTDTDKGDDDSWASGDISEDAVGPLGTVTGKRPPIREETGLREAALKAQRQRELFVKQPKRSYSNSDRTPSSLLSQLLYPDPNMFPSSVTSNQAHASAASTSSHPVNRGRRTKNGPVRPPIMRLKSGCHVVQV
jgi:hypothetical protein